MEKFTIKTFNETYPNDDACLDEIFNSRYGDLHVCPNCKRETKFYRIGSRKTYGCKFCGYQLSPTAGTIFHKSSTSLKNWFYALFLFASSKNGVSAKELQRQLGVTYKTAWRMAKQIRLLFAENIDQLDGIVEIDETFYGGKGVNRRFKLSKPEDKTPVMGMLQRGGKIIAKPVLNTGKGTLLPEIQKNISLDAKIISDEFNSYTNLHKLGYDHSIVRHLETYVKGEIHTNTIEGFWSQLKRSVDGTYHAISKKYLSSYVNEFSFRYNYRKLESPIFSLMLSRAVTPLG